MSSYPITSETIPFEASAQILSFSEHSESNNASGPNITPYSENNPPFTSVDAYPESGIAASHQLLNYAQSQIGWIFSLNLFLVFFCGIYSGRAFDTHGPRLVVALGSIAMVLSLFLLEFCTGKSGLIVWFEMFLSSNLIWKRTGTSYSTTPSSGGSVVPYS
jgi:MFS family permease